MNHREIKPAILNWKTITIENFIWMTWVKKIRPINGKRSLEIYSLNDIGGN
jgi:hypothetical protein